MIRINLLKDAMEREKVTMDDLAKELKICKVSLYYRFNGKVLFKINELKLIKKILKLDTETFSKIFLEV